MVRIFAVRSPFAGVSFETHLILNAAEDIQQESEYTEHYDIATQRHLDSLTKTDVTVLENGATDSNMTEER